jgi:hypothetical protein
MKQDIAILDMQSHESMPLDMFRGIVGVVEMLGYQVTISSTRDATGRTKYIIASVER